MARPTKLDPRVTERIRQAIIDGATYEHAAAAGGIDDATFRRWMARGEREKSGPFCAFRAAIKSADGLCITEALSDIRTAGKRGQWQARAWLLERRYPELYGKAPTQTVEHKHEHSGTVRHTHDLTVLSDEELDTLACIRHKLDCGTPDAGGDSGGAGAAASL